MTTLAYVDASALVKLIVAEPESAAMFRWYHEAGRVATSRIGVVETIRATARQWFDPEHREAVVSDLEIIDFDASIAASASRIGPASLRTLDAAHLATAFALMPELDAFVTYDDRLAEAARALGLPVVRPA